MFLAFFMKENLTMNSKFTQEEKRKWLFKKHIKDHMFEYVFDFIGPIILTMFILYLCEAEQFLYGIILSAVYSLGKMIYQLYHYKKEYIDVDIR